MIAITPEDSEWYTLSFILERVYRTFKGFPDLDPCSNSHTDPNVIAAKHYTKDDDGLNQIWDAQSVFLNPPYGPALKIWINKLISEVLAGNVRNAIVLIPAKTETEYWHNLSQHVKYTCMIRRRVAFRNPAGNTGDKTGTFGSAVLLITYNKDIERRFVAEFRTIGIIYETFTG